MFVKTVFSASEKFDSVPVKLMRGPCHLFVKRCLQLVRNVSVSACVFLRNDTRTARPRSDTVVYPQTASRSWAAEIFSFAK